jgi:hypothetical protein
LAVAVVSLTSGRRTTIRAHEIQARLLALESAREEARVAASRRADLTARVSQRGSSCNLIIRNSGPSAATDVRVLLDDGPLLDHEVVSAGQSEITELGPGVEISYLLAVAMGDPDAITVSIAWRDASDIEGRWRSQLRV